MHTETLPLQAAVTSQAPKNWQALLPEQDRAKALEMAEHIARSIMSTGPEERGISLTQEDSGLILFFHYLARQTGNTVYSDYAAGLLEDCVAAIGADHCKYNFADGIAGFGWMINHLAQQNFIDDDVDSFLGDVDGFMIQCLEHDLSRFNFDFFWGASGIVTYLLNRTHVPEVKTAVENYLNFLEANFCHPEEDKVWAHDVINLTFAHGLPSVLANVLTAYHRGILPTKTQAILRSGIDFVVNTRLDPVQYGSHFGFILDKEKEVNGSRIAWCQGDLIMGQFLIRAARALEDTSLEAFGVEVLTHTAGRREHAQTLVNDCSFCHGTSGNMHMFARAWHLSPQPEFLDAVQFWYRENLTKARYIEDRLEFHPLMGGEHTDYFKDDSVTMGSAGVGLCLLSAATTDAPAWDEAFHLSLS